MNEKPVKKEKEISNDGFQLYMMMIPEAIYHDSLIPICQCLD